MCFTPHYKETAVDFKMCAVNKYYLLSIIFALALGKADARTTLITDLNSVKGSNDYVPNNFTDTYLNLEKFDDDYNEVDYYDEPECKPSVMPPNPKSMCCGVDVSTFNRIIGGPPTLINQYPWLVHIEYKEKENGKFVSNCGGSLISSLYVLTAAHCVSGDMLKEFTPRNVVLGDYDLSHNGPDCITKKGIKRCSKTEVRIGIKKYIPHEFYDEKLFTNDIGLIKLKKMAPYTDFIRPICLPTSDLAKTHLTKIWLTAAGWGAMKQIKKKGEYIDTYSNVKRHVRLPYVPLQVCMESWDNLTKYQICAGGEKGKDACAGDSGGPLMYNNDGQFELTGVVSFGADDPCGQKNLPGVYANVYKYKKWILEIITGRH